jgi:hypothetical protein
MDDMAEGTGDGDASRAGKGKISGTGGFNVGGTWCTLMSRHIVVLLPSAFGAQKRPRQHLVNGEHRIPHSVHWRQTATGTPDFVSLHSRPLQHVEGIESEHTTPLLVHTGLCNEELCMKESLHTDD